MDREKAKQIKKEFINMSQMYNGREITDMWDMMCDQLFDEIENINNTKNVNSIEMPVLHESVGEEYMQEIC